MVKTSAFVAAQIQVDTTFCNTLSVVTPPILSSLSQLTALQDSHSWICPGVHNIHDCLEQYMACKFASPTTTSALIAVPTFHRRKSWHKYLKGMLCISHVSKDAEDFQEYVCSDPLQTHRWSYDIWYDSPISQASLNYTSDDSLDMIFACSVSSNLPCSVLVDSGASHNFID